MITDKINPKFGVDLAIPQVGGSARKTNHDYTHGKLPELIDVIIEEKVTPCHRVRPPDDAFIVGSTHASSPHPCKPAT
jgi:hypothetical protein